MWPEWINLLTWWQWTILAAVPPAIVALYFLKLKRRPLEVPSTYLWHKSIEDLRVNSLWQRLRRSLLLFLQLLLVLLVMLAVLQPSWRTQRLPGNRFIFLIDDSASMRATDVKPSRLEEAKRQAIETIDQMVSGDVAMVVSFSDVARVEQMFTDSRRMLRESVSAIQPTNRSTSLEEALRVASGLANPSRSGKDATDIQVADPRPATVFLFSDGRFDDVSNFSLGNLQPIYRLIGTSEAANVGIVAMSVRRHESKPDQLQVFARLENFGDQSASVSGELLLDGNTIDAFKNEIEVGKSLALVFSLSAVDSGVLDLRVTTGDCFADDDEAWAVISAPPRTRALVITSGNRQLHRAFSTKAAEEFGTITFESTEFLSQEKYRQQTTSGEYDLVIYDRCVPKEPPRANALYLGVLPPGGAWRTEAEVKWPQIMDVDPSHPLTQWMDLADVTVMGLAPLVPPLGGRTLVDTNRGALLAVAPREGYEDIVLGVPVGMEAVSDGAKPASQAGTDWDTKLSFAAFAINLLQYAGGNRGDLGGGIVRPGQQVTLDTPGVGKSLVVQTPTKRTVQVKEGKPGKGYFHDTEELGVYQVPDSGPPPQRFCVNLFLPKESDLRVNRSVKLGEVSVEAHTSPETSRRELWKGLLLLGLAVLILEWYIYNRRVYV